MSEGPNPFAPPKADWENPAVAVDAGDYVDASQGARLVNFFLDQFIRVGMMVGIAALLGDSPILVLFVTFGYHIFFESIFSRTPAKWLTRTRVVALDGSRPTFWQIVGRSFARYVPFEPFSFLGSARGWHDRWSNTRVVRDTRVSEMTFPKD